MQCEYLANSIEGSLHDMKLSTSPKYFAPYVCCSDNVAYIFVCACADRDG